jgi:hypothetical protein
MSHVWPRLALSARVTVVVVDVETIHETFPEVRSTLDYLLRHPLLKFVPIVLYLNHWHTASFTRFMKVNTNSVGSSVPEASTNPASICEALSPSPSPPPSSPSPMTPTDETHITDFLRHLWGDDAELASPVLRARETKRLSVLNTTSAVSDSVRAHALLALLRRHRASPVGEAYREGTEDCSTDDSGTCVDRGTGNMDGSVFENDETARKVDLGMARAERRDGNTTTMEGTEDEVEGDGDKTVVLSEDTDEVQPEMEMEQEGGEGPVLAWKEPGREEDVEVEPGTETKDADLHTHPHAGLGDGEWTEEQTLPREVVMVG